MLSAFSGSADVVKLLLEANARVQVVDGRGRTALQWALIEYDPKVAQLLVRAQPGIETDKQTQATILVEACQWGRQEVAELVVEMRCSVNRTARTVRSL